ncbi:MAG: PaaI family thioesterase [Flavobacteriales bacterium AspAUS03]
MEKDSTILLKRLNETNDNTLMKTLHITYIKVGSDFLVAQMPVDTRVHQPMGFLHGGATVALAESTGSMLSAYTVNREKFQVFGLEISANHIRSKKKGILSATACLIHKGKTTHFIQIEVCDEDGLLISQCKMTNIISPKK